MTGTATSRPAEDNVGVDPVAVAVRSRVSATPELRRAYRALGRPPALRPEARQDEPRDGQTTGPSGRDRVTEPPVSSPVPPALSVARPDGPIGGFPVRLRPLDRMPKSVIDAAILVSITGPDSCSGRRLDLLVDASGRPYVRLTVALGPKGRSGTGGMAVALSAPQDLSAFLREAEGSGPGSLAVPGPGTCSTPRMPLGMDCLTSDGRLAPRPT